MNIHGLIVTVNDYDVWKYLNAFQSIAIGVLPRVHFSWKRICMNILGTMMRNKI